MLERITFRKVANLLPDAVVLCDTKGRITWTNKAFHDLCGYSRAEVKDRKPGSFLQGPETDQETVAHIREALRKRKPVEAELLNYHQNGRPYWVSLRITTMRDNKGKLEGFIALEREITDSKCQQYSLEEEVGQMYSTIIKLVGSE